LSISAEGNLRKGKRPATVLNPLTEAKDFSQERRDKYFSPPEFAFVDELQCRQAATTTYM
jgi:hypothetical protein